MDSTAPSSNSPTYRYQVLLENQAQANRAHSGSEQFDDIDLRSPFHRKTVEDKSVLGMGRRLLIFALLIIIYALYMFNSRVDYTRRSAVLFKRGTCSANGRHSYSSKYAVIFDAGSTGSRIHVYEFLFCEGRLVNLIDELFEQVKPGLSSFSERPKQAVESLTPLLREAWRRVPRELRKCTPVVLKATAGLRLLPIEKVAGILDRVKSWLKAQPFHLPRYTKSPASMAPESPISVIDGSEEAISAWISINFLQNRFGLDKPATSVVIEMGGGSAQVVFDQNMTSSSELPGSVIDLSIFGRNFHLYQHSYLGYGLMEARKQMKSGFEGWSKTEKNHDSSSSTLVFPCFPSGYSETLKSGFQLTGESHETNWENCVGLAKSLLFHKDAPCKQHPCSFNGVHQPAIDPNAPIYALSYIHDLAHDLGLASTSGFTLGELKTRAQRICFDDYHSNMLLQKNPFFCLDSAIIHSLLNYGLGISETRQIQSGQSINNYQTGWTLGSALAVIENSPSYCKAP